MDASVGAGPRTLVTAGTPLRGSTRHIHPATGDSNSMAVAWFAQALQHPLLLQGSAAEGAPAWQSEAAQKQATHSANKCMRPPSGAHTPLQAMASAPLHATAERTAHKQHGAAV
jgi:hypothetical protein